MPWSGLGDGKVPPADSVRQEQEKRSFFFGVGRIFVLVHVNQPSRFTGLPFSFQCGTFVGQRCFQIFGLQLLVGHNAFQNVPKVLVRQRKFDAVGEVLVMATKNKKI